ncbi:HTH domain-containing protein [Haloglomus litoreum]|uniref:HTH domain-containing protein n=1 Tax=Haloglomus litoreum TaxID=3034026 RepID=UPI0023E84C3B|nr:HTH domain-containing protein [Haloglomus sp. DT116]
MRPQPEGHQGEPSTVELWVRSLGHPSVFQAQRDLSDRLHRLEASDIVDQAEVEVWGREVVLSGATARTEPGRRFMNRLGRFREWAERNDATLEPCFEFSTTSSEFTGEEYTVVDLPVCALAEFDGDELVHVAPCTVGERVRTVEDRLSRLESGYDLDGPLEADHPEDVIDQLVPGTASGGRQ